MAESQRDLAERRQREEQCESFRRLSQLAMHCCPKADSTVSEGQGAEFVEGMPYDGLKEYYVQQQESAALYALVDRAASMVDDCQQESPQHGLACSMMGHGT